MPNDADYTIADLARLTGLSVRTIRYYLAQGLIPASGESGPGAHYGQGHLDRLQLIKRLQTEYLPNAEIRRRLSALSDDDVASLIAEPVTDDPSRPTTSALDYVRGVLGSNSTVGAAQLIATPLATPPPAREAAPPPAAQVIQRLASLPGPMAGSIVPLRPPRPPRAPSSEIREAIAIPDPAADKAVRRRLEAAELAASAAETPTAAPDAPANYSEAPAPAMPSMRDQPEPLALERSQWERLSLGPNVELHIRRPLSRHEQKRVDRLITIARQVLKEGRS
jgi:DNA-binding transcriptional MerR regulator